MGGRFPPRRARSGLPDGGVRRPVCRALRYAPQEDAQLIDHYDATKVHVMTFDDEHIYHQGFLDCVYLLRWLGLL